MKKIVLLLTLLCASQLYSMEISHDTNYMATLPQDIKKYIISILIQSQTLEEAIQTVRSLAQTNTEFNAIINDPLTMRMIIRSLTQKFSTPSEYVAQQLSTSGSQQYVALSLQLMHALWQHNWDQAENLLKAGADVDFQTADTYPAICGLEEGMRQQWDELSPEKDKDIILEVQKGTIVSRRVNGIATLIATNTHGCIVGACFSLVMYAVISNQPAILKWLTKHNANLNLTIPAGDTALLMAINIGAPDMVKWLINNGADINQQNKVNEKITKIFPYSANSSMTKKLNHYYDTTLYNLLDNKTIQRIIITAIRRAGATPILKLLSNSSQFTQEEFNDLLILLINKGANLNMQDDDGNTPLRRLVFTNGHANIMKIFLDHGANPSIKDNDGMNALERMLFEGTSESDPEREEKIRLLEDAMEKHQSSH